ncbi:MAG: hypothetical protein U5J97_02080 [Trueperaceae bacterium]|nr:hypothetical protein [Trueperaceae bacterium]
MIDKVHNYLLDLWIAFGAVPTLAFATFVVLLMIRLVRAGTAASVALAMALRDVRDLGAGVVPVGRAGTDRVRPDGARLGPGRGSICRTPRPSPRRSGRGRPNS